MITPEQALAIYHAGPEAVVKVICDLSRQVDLLQQRVEALERQVARLSKNSSNSSKPPSSDITKPGSKLSKGGKEKRKIGAQPGHPRHERPAFPEADIRTFFDYRLEACPKCGNADVTFLDEPPHVLQQMEIEKVVVFKDEHRSYPVWCERRLTALVAYMKAVDHASFSTIRKFVRDFNITVQFCIAHLIREIKYLSELPDAETRAYGKKLLAAVKLMFRVIHDRDRLGDKAFGKALEQARLTIMKAALEDVPSRLDAKGKEQKREAFNMAKRFRENGKAYFEFITTPGIGPTNNLAEQAVRFVVIDRRITQGTRSLKGRATCERLWTVVGTCSMQGRSAFEFILAAVRAHFRGEPAPSLLPALG